MKKLIVLLICALGLMVGCQSAETESTTQADSQKPSKETSVEWNLDKITTATINDFIYHIIPSTDGSDAWIYKITPNGKTTSLNIPEIINNMKVTKLGYTFIPTKKDEIDDNEFNQTIFGEWVEYGHNSPGYGEAEQGIEQVIIPDTVTEIETACFSGMEDLKEITIPSGVQKLQGETFYGCKNLEKIIISEKLKAFELSDFSKCKKLKSIVVPKDSKTYYSENNCLIEKNKRKLVLAYGEEETLEIPNGVEVLSREAFSSNYSKKIVIPASVNKIEKYAFQRANGYSTDKIKDVIVDEKNKTFARDGQCIYNKKSKTLVVGINKNKNFILSKKIEKLEDGYSIIGINTYETHFKKVVFPKSIYFGKDALSSFSLSCNFADVYFYSDILPKISSSSLFPTSCTIHVPKKALGKYKSLYKKYGKLKYVDKWETIF